MDDDWKNTKKIEGWSGRYTSTYNEMADAIKKLSGLKRDLKIGGSVDQAARRQKIRKKKGEYSLEYVDGQLSILKKYMKIKKEAEKAKQKKQ